MLEQVSPQPWAPAEGPCSGWGGGAGTGTPLSSSLSSAELLPTPGQGTGRRFAALSCRQQLWSTQHRRLQPQGPSSPSSQWSPSSRGGSALPGHSQASWAPWGLLPEGLQGACSASYG